MAFWIFKCNPNKYLLNKRLEDLHPTIAWTVSQYRNQIKPDDIAFIYETETNKAIRATLYVNKAAELMYEYENQRQYWREPDNEEKWRAVCTLDDHRPINLQRNQLEAREVLNEEPSIFKRGRLSIYPITEEQGQLLLQLAENGMQDNQ